MKENLTKEKSEKKETIVIDQNKYSIYLDKNTFIIEKSLKITVICTV